ncbi:phenylalanine--tRNA ligase subunit beta [Thorsellia anophelis]|uniref:Phenylalanine--tRNA ligase beta subunit n=1 Tax=Thorsellia anophelis DSM 18579 TaxID=1123402 RepID=A0A1I0DJE1_9GAMM|nr:phenylalanine--tRNA ligase subunit beta [Thorsellia anophelis]SET32578.1 phenylalanyl-tRNA synthetase beta subunit [Thorsellia anophelis DSM 18579]
MKFSENWLRSLVNIEVASTQLHEQITMLGLEVDDILPVAGTFDQVVVGEVVSANQHPNADKLRVTKVNIGQDELVDIVCGAPNCRSGIKVAVALVGATLPGEFKIKSAKLRGEPSEGMLCSYSELGISDDHNGIIELPLDAPIGMDLRKYLDLDDNIIEISVTPNRADANSLLGISRDVAAYYNVPISMPKIDKTVATISDTKIINLLAPEACPIYLGRIIKNIDMTASTPIWLKERLRRSGIRSIDPIVDITNYVLIELGQPMHAFDFDSLEGSINVRLALENETITLLDGNQVKLDKDVLVIADDKKALAMAGIFGGLDSGVTSKTRTIFLESAFFSPLAITGRARRYGLHTDASYRYERGVDPKLAAIAMDRATQLITEICGGEVSDILTAVDETKTPAQPLITLRYERLEKLLGYTIDSSLIAPILTRLGCEVSSISSDAHAIAWQVKAPSWRFDMSIEEDLIEEVARIHGYDKIQSANILSELVIRNQPESTLKLENAKQTLINRGYFEAITYSFVDPKIQSLIHPNEASEILPHPISVEMSAMRLSLLPGLLTTAQYNQNRQQTRLRLFEFGLCFIPDANEELKVKQKPVLAGVLTGMRYPEHWSFDKSHADYFDAKGDVEAILSLTGRKDEVRFEVSTKSFLHPGQSAEIFIGENQVGFVGVLHPLLEKKLDLNSKTMVFQLDWECINNCIIPSPQELSKFPANRRDIAIIVNKCVSSQKILQICKDVGEKQLVDVNLFDVYDGKGIAEGDKSLAISLVLQERHRTLTEEEISETVNACIMALKQQVAASLRE